MDRASLVARGVAGLLGATLLASCGGATTTDGGETGAAAGGAEGEELLVLVTPDRVGVNEFIRNGVKGVENAAAEVGAQSRVFESTDPSTMAQNVEAAIQLNPDVIVALGFNFQDLMNQLPPQHPDQQFLLVDACVEEAAPNLTCAVFSEHEAIFLAGAEAGMLTDTDVVAAVASLDSPFIRRFSDPFGQGAEHVNPEVEYRELFVGGSSPFNDPARAKEQALTLVGAGADYVMASAGAGNLGVYEAAEERDFKVFSIDVDQCSPVAPGHIVDNLIKRVDVAVTNGVQAILDGNAGGVQVYGLKEGGVTLSGLQDDVEQSQCLIANHPDVLERIRQLEQEIIDGEITVRDPAQG